MIQKQIQLAKNGNASTGDTAKTTSDAAASQDLLAAGGALGDLLALGQMLEKKLNLASTDATTSGSASTSAASTDLATLDMQLRANLKTLMDSLQAATTAAAKGTSATADTTDANVITSNLTLAATSTANATADKMTSTPDDIISGALATADDFLKQLNSLYGTSATTANLTTTIAADAVAAASGGNGSSLDADANGGNTNAAPTATPVTAQNTDTSSVPADSTKSTSPYSFASQLSALRAQNGGTTGLPTAIEQVLLQLNRNAKSGNDQMSIQLHPADLGSINVKLDFANDGTVSGTVIASNADTLSMLQKDSRSLERALQEAGLRADPGSLQFSLGGQQQQNNNPGQTAQNQSGTTPSSNGTGGDLAVLTPDAGVTTSDNWIITPGRVNIRV